MCDPDCPPHGALPLSIVRHATSSSRASIGADRQGQSFIARHAWWWLIGIAFLYYLTYFNYGIDLDDEGFFLLNSASILQGQWPMADFFSYEPLSYFLLALFFKVVGNGVLTERIMLLGLILLNVWLVYYCARKLLPSPWALIPAAIYAFAPGPWYKVFFISHLLLSLAALLCFLERPGIGRAALAGLTAGLAAVSRVEAGAMIVILTAVFLAVHSWLGGDPTITAGTHSRLGRLQALSRFEGSFFMGFSVPVAGVLAAYLGAGKLPALLHNAAHYYNISQSTSYANAIPSLATVFSVKELFVGLSREMWVYAVAMLACLFNAARYCLEALVRRAASQNALAGLAIATFGVGSMGYTYFYVWNSRMLSSFAIVYINYVALLFFVQQKLTASGAGSRVISATVGVGIVAVLFYLNSFILVQNYSGSYTTNVPGAMTTVDIPVLKGIHIYADQAGDIMAMRRLTAGAPKGSYLVSMSEATTMGYIAGLPNPTYYRLFLAEFAPPGERERAIQTFERYRVRYFVARRSQFLPGGNHSSNLDAYAPQIKAYLVARYRVIPLGDNFVLLERKLDS